EIRTPMNGVLVMAEMLAASELPPRARKNADVIVRSGQTLLAIINDILDFSKIEAGKLDLDNLPFAVRDSIGDAMRLLSVRAHNKGLELAYRIPPEVPIALRGDAGRLRQVLLNLVGNAIKFTVEGEVVVVVELVEQGDDAVELQFTVRDTGIGIEPDKQQTIFEAFEQADGSTTRQYGGTGLGLAVSARLVELMGGEIGVESAPGQGSTFHFTARFGTADPSEAAVVPLDAEELRGLKVLIVDDNSTNRLILEEMVHGWEMRPQSVESGPAALAAMWTALEAHDPYRLVLCDGNMPTMDGYSLARRINDTRDFERPVVIMLTSGGMVDQGALRDELCLAACLIKPVKQSDLFDAVATAMAGDDPTRSEATVHEETEHSTTVGRRILLAEDSVVNQKLAVGLLERRGHVVRVANNGKETLELFEREPFDVILMDVQMPEMDGLEATAAIRAKEAISGRHMPIIAMTAHAMQGDRERCLAAGMDDYLAKPIRAEGLFAAIEAAVGCHEDEEAENDEARSACGNEAAACPADDSTTAGEMHDPVIDWIEALDRVGDDEELLRDVVDAFLQESPALLDNVRQAIDLDDTKTLQRAAHTLKTSFGHFGAIAAAELARELESLGSEGRTDGAAPLYGRLQERAGVVLDALKRYFDQGIKT
ncbi:MAG: response regulator, partial [Planctomycetales bacterium]|nr:response regulator [Planctomycetales bacterium]